MWVLTCSVNDYNQHGEYFIAVWAKKPTLEQLEHRLGHRLAELVLSNGTCTWDYDEYILAEYSEDSESPFCPT